MGLLTNPRQTVIVTCRARGARVMGVETEKDNAITIDWHMPVSFSPQLYAIAVGKSRFSYKILTESKAFVVNFIPETMAKEATFCGRRSGEHRDKLKEAEIKTHEADNIDCPRIVGAVGYLECEVIQEVEAGDHVIFIGKVVHAELVKEQKRLFHVDGDDFTTTVKG
jgi:flavin reductase (DIM6/NTAB) family NADH-FMN oxidoreductase RutF